MILLTADMPTSQLLHYNHQEKIWICGNHPKNGNDMRKFIEEMKVPESATKELPVDALAAQKRQWEKFIDKMSKKEIILEENIKTLYSSIWG